MTFVNLLALKPTFDASARLVPAGGVAVIDAGTLREGDKNLAELPAGAGVGGIAAISPLGPTGPNPTGPQQIPPDARQGPDGHYYLPDGTRLVAEVTRATALGDPTGISQEQIEAAGGEEALRAAAAARADQVGGSGSGTLTRSEESQTGQDGGGKPGDDLVSGSVAAITAKIGERTDAELVLMKSAEQRGSAEREAPRATLIKAIDAEIERRAEAAKLMS